MIFTALLATHLYCALAPKVTHVCMPSTGTPCCTTTCETSRDGTQRCHTTCY